MRCAVVQVLCGTILASCGTLVAPGPFPMKVDSLPSGAVVVYEGKEVGVTPCTVPMGRSSTLIEVRLDGYLAQPVDVGAVPNPWVAGNILTLGLGMYVDKAVGSDRNPDTGPLEVRLVAGRGPARDPWVRGRGGHREMSFRGIPGRLNTTAASSRREEGWKDVAAQTLGGFFVVLIRAAIAGAR
jgi:hypothetical protein